MLKVSNWNRIKPINVLQTVSSMLQISMKLTHIARGHSTHARISKRDFQSLSNPIHKLVGAAQKAENIFVVHENASYECRSDYIIWISSRAWAATTVKCVTVFSLLITLLSHRSCGRDFYVIQGNSLSHTRLKLCLLNNQLDDNGLRRNNHETLTINICLSLRSFLREIKANNSRAKSNVCTKWCQNATVKQLICCRLSHQHLDCFLMASSRECWHEDCLFLLLSPRSSVNLHGH